MANEGHYEPCLVPLAPAISPSSRGSLNRPELRAALEVALEWIDMRCDTKEFPQAYAMILEALDG